MNLGAVFVAFALSALSMAPMAPAPEARVEEAPPVPQRSFWEYVELGATFGAEWVQPVDDGFVPAWLLGSLFNHFGGHMWAPLLFYENRPWNRPAKIAVALGATMMAIGWLYSSLIVLNVVGAVFLLLCSPIVCCLNWVVIPRAIAAASADAYRLRDWERAHGGDIDDAPRRPQQRHEGPRRPAGRAVSADSLFLAIQAVLPEYGYEISDANLEARYVSTNWKEETLGGEVVSTKMRVSVEGSPGEIQVDMTCKTRDDEQGTWKAVGCKTLGGWPVLSRRLGEAQAAMMEDAVRRSAEQL